MFGNGIPEIKESAEGVRFKFHLQTAMGRPDEEKVIEVRYADFSALSNLPRLVFTDDTMEMKYLFFYTKQGPLAFTYENYSETWSGPWSEESVTGPYRWEHHSASRPPILLSVYERIGKKTNLVLALYRKSMEREARECQRRVITENERKWLSHGAR